MAIPKYTALIAKVRDYANKPEVNTIPDSIIDDCLLYAADFCYYRMRVPQLEAVTSHTVVANDNVNTNKAYTKFSVPANMTEFLSIHCSAPASNQFRFVEVVEKRTFFDQYKLPENTYSWMWRDQNIYIYPQLPIGSVVESSFYCRLADIDSADNGGVETYHWLRDDKEYILIWSALSFLGAYLFDDALTARYKALAIEAIDNLNNREDKSLSLLSSENRKEMLKQNTRKISI